MRLRLLTATAATALLLPVLPAFAVPIGGSPDGDSVQDFIGSPRPAKPMGAQRFAPRHPFMAANGRSNIHDDAYQSDAGPTPGPLGYDPEVVSTLFTQECASVTFDRQGRLLTVCVGVENVTLRMLDPQTLDVLAQYELPPRAPSPTPFASFGGGGYFYLDHRDRVVVPTSDGTIQVVKDTGTPDAPVLTLARTYDVSAQANGASILSALPDWHGRLWFITADGTVGVVNRRTGAVKSVETGEGIGNSFAVDETGAVFIVTDAALYRYVAKRGKPVATWRRTYDGGDRTKPGQTQQGSGTTPTIVQRGSRKYVAITDNADPRMHLLVYRAGARKPGKPICKQAVFGKRTGSTDNSLIALKDSFVVENNYGYSGPFADPSNPSRQSPTTEPGVTRVVVDYRGGGCHVGWANRKVRVPSSVSKASTVTGLVYVYEHPAADEIRYDEGEPESGPQDPWYLTALDARTGRRVWSVLAGVGFGFNNNYAPITLGPDGKAYVGVLGGIVAIRDTYTP